MQVFSETFNLKRLCVKFEKLKVYQNWMFNISFCFYQLKIKVFIFVNNKWKLVKL